MKCSIIVFLLLICDKMKMYNGYFDFTNYIGPSDVLGTLVNYYQKQNKNRLKTLFSIGRLF